MNHKIWRLLSDWRLLLYNAAILAGSPYFLLRKLRRQITRNGAKEFRMFNWSCPLLYPPSEENADAPHVVFVSVGLGEMHTTAQLDYALKQIHPRIKTTWAVKNHDTALVVREKFPDQAVTAIPFDFLIPAWRWLWRLDPSVVVMVEKFLAPNLVVSCHCWGAKVLAACGKAEAVRLTGIQGAYSRPIYHWILRCFSLICFQNSQAMDSMKTLLPADAPARVTGRMNLSQSGKSAAGNGVSASLSIWLSARTSTPLLIAGSTRDVAEETLILKAFEIVRAQTPCALVLAPRRLSRAEEVLELLSELGIKRVSRRSEYSGAAPPDSAIDVFLLDTLGELSQAYAFAQAAYVGGTLCGPGHNVIEPLEWGVPVAFGPGRGKPTSEQQSCIEAGVGFCVRDEQQLADLWLSAVQNQAWREQLKNDSQRILQEQRQALTNNVAAIVEMLSTPPAK